LKIQILPHKKHISFHCGDEIHNRNLRKVYAVCVFGDRVLRIFGPKGDEMTGDWRKMHNEELLNLYSSPNIIRMIKSRRMRCTGQVA
jgi:hypothetical protein